MTRNEIERMIQDGETTIQHLIDKGVIVASNSLQDLIADILVKAKLTIKDISILIANSDNFSQEISDYIYFCDEYSDNYELYYIKDEVKDWMGF